MGSGNLGIMIEEKLEEAGVKLAVGYRLVLLDVPGIEIGGLTMDVTNRSRLFRHYLYRNMSCATGMPYIEGTTFTRETIKEAISAGSLQPGRVSMKAFRVDMKKSQLLMGRLRPNRSVCVTCQHCNRTYHRDELQIVAQGHNFFCRACLDKATKAYKALPAREKKKGRNKRPTRHTFRLDRDRNILRYESPTLDKRMIDELVTAAAIPPEQGGTIRLPRPFVMFEPGASKVVWEPAADDKVGQELKMRCARVTRGSARGQQPVPLEMVIDAYAPKNWDRRPWKNNTALTVPGSSGVQLLVDHRLAGWVSAAELKPDLERHGWWREFPEYVVEDYAPAREV